MNRERKIYNTNNPPHLIANELIRAIEGYLWEGGVGVEFGDKGHELVDDFVTQYQNECSAYHDAAAISDIENQKLKDLLKRAKSYLAYTQKMTRLYEADKLMALFHDIDVATWED